MMNQKKYICGVVIGTALLMAAAAYEDSQKSVIDQDGNVIRRAPGEGDYETTLNITVPDLGETRTYPLIIEEQEYTGQEREALFERAKQEIDQTFPGAGENCAHITKAVNLRETLQSGMISVSWSFENGTIIQSDGEIEPSAVSAEGVIEIVRAEMSYREYTCIYEFPVVIYREELEGMDKVLQDVRTYLEQENKAASAQPKLHLPREAGAYVLRWSQKKEYTPLFVMAMGLGTIFAIISGSRRQEQQRRAKRNRELQMEYPKMVAKMSLLIGAGMTTRTAWEKQVETYVRQLEQGKQKRMELYEQMQITGRQMQEGIGERSAYEQFGEHLGLSVYRRFSLMLIQNLQKGTAGLGKALEAEADRAFEERKNTARRLGEEAGTKLLLPMMMMLFAIIIILVVPAFLTMTI